MDYLPISDLLFSVSVEINVRKLGRSIRIKIVIRLGKINIRRVRRMLSFYPLYKAIKK
jgi:hypothetical protein